MSAVVAGCLLQRPIQRWLPAFRRLDVRVQTEIEEERRLLNALRGDFAGIEGREAQWAPAADYDKRNGTRYGRDG